MEWREQDGPPIENEPQPGLGTQIIEGLTRSDLRGQATLSYPNEGVHHVFQMMLFREGSGMNAFPEEV